MNKDLTPSLIFLDHAKERMEQRGIAAREVEEALGGSAPAPGPVPGMQRILGTTAAGRRLAITRLERFPVIISVVEESG